MKYDKSLFSNDNAVNDLVLSVCGTDADNVVAVTINDCWVTIYEYDNNAIFAHVLKFATCQDARDCTVNWIYDNESTGYID